MPYEFLPELATADIAFRVTSPTREGCFCESVEAMLHVTVNNPDEVKRKIKKEINIETPELDLLLFDLLQECIFLKDTERLLVHCDEVRISKETNWRCQAFLSGEPLEASRHHQRVDVKAITLHQFSLQQVDSQWVAQMILDI
jgi:SHS2 domain-containing protein